MTVWQRQMRSYGAQKYWCTKFCTTIKSLKKKKETTAHIKDVFFFLHVFTPSHKQSIYEKAPINKIN